MIDYFIIGHNPAICSSTISLDHIFLQVGDRSTINHDTNIIQCYNLDFNLEEYKYLCSFTGWYAVAKNKLSQKNYICLLEYDCVILPTLYENNNKILKHNPQSIIAYSYTQTNHYVFTKSTPWLEISLKHIHNIDLQDFIRDYSEQFNIWPTTTNITMSTDVLNAFVEWFEPMTKIFRHDKLGAYVHERAFFIFCVINNIQINYCLNTIKHLQKQSHGIYDIYGDILQQHNTYYLTDSVKTEYDTLYNQKFDEAISTLKDTDNGI